jgi:chemotaxis protein histidine kinase CheA
MSDELLNEFIFDSREHLGTAGAQLLELEKDPGSLRAINALMGTMHTIKGNSGFLDLANLYKLMHHAESLLQTARETNQACPPKLIDLLLQVLDTVEALLNRLENGDDDQVEWLKALNQALSEAEASLEGSPAPAAPSAAVVESATNQPSGSRKAASDHRELLQLPREGLSGKINLVALKDGQLADEDELFPNRVEAMFAAGLKGLVVDLRGLGSVTSRELKVLMNAGRKNPEKTSFLLDFQAQEALYRIFQVLHLDSFMHFFADQDAALTHIKGAH